jgi:hypothetical protein
MHAGELCGATVDTTLQYSTVSIGISHGMGYKGYTDAQARVGTAEETKIG